jgi:putative phosphoesterase
MRIAALADIHSNVFALEAVVGDAKQRGADLMVNVGDVLYGPIAPRATFDFLGQHDFITISGNQDRQICEVRDNATDSNPTMDFVLRDLGEAPVSWMKSLPFGKQVNEDIYLCHGTPTNDMEYLLENVEDGSPKLRSDSEITELLGGQSSNVVICGHTHVPRTVALSTGQLIVNPGSVGLPAYTDDLPVAHSMENFCPHASYAILEQGGSGWTVQQVKVPYDYQKAVREVEKHGREDWAHFLKTGRGL